MEIMNTTGQKNAIAFLLLNGKSVLVQLILDLRNLVWLELGKLKWLLGGYPEHVDRRSAPTRKQ